MLLLHTISFILFLHDLENPVVIMKLGIILALVSTLLPPIEPCMRDDVTVVYDWQKGEPEEGYHMNGADWRDAEQNQGTTLKGSGEDQKRKRPPGQQNGLWTIVSILCYIGSYVFYCVVPTAVHPDELSTTITTVENVKTTTPWQPNIVMRPLETSSTYNRVSNVQFILKLT